MSDLGLGLIRRIAYVSLSTDIFTNLAWEHWWYLYGNLVSQKVLLFYRNKPCVVIGRHQNPWIECNLMESSARKVPVARRQSGGGCVYHDEGNLNCSFITSRKEFDRNGNLETLAGLLRNFWNVDVTVSRLGNLLLDGMYKISGSAAKLGKDTAYHHCTLLVNSDLQMMQMLLHPDRLGFKSKATNSLPARVANLSSAANFTISNVITQVAATYCWHSDSVLTSQDLLNYVEPSDKLFPGLDKIRNELESWEWVYGRTPNFEINRCVELPSGAVADLKISVNRGRIDDMSIETSEELAQVFYNILLQLKGFCFYGKNIARQFKVLRSYYMHLAKRAEAITPLERQSLTDTFYLMNFILDIVES